MEKEFKKNKQANDEFDSIFEIELEKRLKRKPSRDELVNNDNDSDLVNEVLWQMVENLYNRIEKLENKK